MIRQLTGDCRATLPTLAPASIQSVITSPPYYGLRDYGTEPLAWGAWLGSLGLEPTPDLYIEHLVECFRHVRRVLRDDGTLWLNLGDSYNAYNGNRGPSRSISEHADQARNEPSRGLSADGLKPKDLMMVPFRVALALQADGWWLRSVIPWLKRCSMPESVTDRPSTAVEYVFLLSKSARYLWDADAVRVEQPAVTAERYKQPFKDRYEQAAAGGYRGKYGGENGHQLNPNGRNRRNSDWFFESWQGLLLDRQDDPLAFVVNPRPFTGAHFATFPPKLIEPMVKASTRPDDTVLDCFSGAGTVGLVADRLGRGAILCELKDSYSNMSADRIMSDAPMFTTLAAD